MALEGALGVFGERTGGAFTSSARWVNSVRSPPVARAFASRGHLPGAHSGEHKRPHRPSRCASSWQHGDRFVRCTGCPQPVEAAMRWLVGWSSTAARAPRSARRARRAATARRCTRWGPNSCGATPIRSGRSATGGPTRCASSRPTQQTRLAVLGICGATDEQLRVGLFAARGGALRHLTAWSGSYTAVVQVGRRITVCGDLAGARPVFHTPWAGGTAYATAALPLADLIEANLDFGHLAALLAAPTYRPRSSDSHAVRGGAAHSARARPDPARRRTRDRRVRAGGLPRRRGRRPPTPTAR